MISVQQCAEYAGLATDELIVGVAACRRHHVILATYLFNLDRGAAAVRDMIVADLRGFLDLGAFVRAADAFVALRLFLTEYPEARSELMAEAA